MKKICVVTATRAEFGLLLPVIRKLKENSEVECQVVVTGSHLSAEFGMTVNDIVSEGIEISKQIDILMGSDYPSSISKTMGIAMISFAEYFKEACPDALLVLGDRYEILAICCAAMNERIPILHMYGGDKTEGAIDEAVRHMITKMSYLHFTATEQYRKRVIQLGEDPERVFCVGSTGIENVIHTDFLNKEDFEKQIGFSLGDKYAVATFHPVTLEDNTSESQIVELMKSVGDHQNINFLFTKANADEGGRRINSIVLEYSKKLNNLILVDSLGVRKYLSAVRWADFVIGNSSSGIAEAPALGVPTVNIGDRQKGRLKPDSVVDCKPFRADINDAIKVVMSSEYRKKLCKSTLYGDGNTSKKVVDIIMSFLMNDSVDTQKHFYDIDFVY